MVIFGIIATKGGVGKTTLSANTSLAQPHWQAIMIGTQTLAVRAAMIQTMLPTLALAYFVAIFDGIVARWIRRVSGGRESSTIYHRAKYFHAVGVTLLLMTWFWYPGHMDFELLALAMATAGGMLSSLTADISLTEISLEDVCQLIEEAESEKKRGLHGGWADAVKNKVSVNLEPNGPILLVARPVETDQGTIMKWVQVEVID